MTVELIELSSLLPSGWNTWFYEMLSEGAPFTWGDNNRSLITAERLRNACDDLDEAYPKEGVTEEFREADIESFTNALEAMGQTYIDLEN